MLRCDHRREGGYFMGGLLTAAGAALAAQYAVGLLYANHVAYGMPLHPVCLGYLPSCAIDDLYGQILLPVLADHIRWPAPLLTANVTRAPGAALPASAFLDCYREGFRDGVSWLAYLKQTRLGWLRFLAPLSGDYRAALRFWHDAAPDRSRLDACLVVGRPPKTSILNHWELMNSQNRILAQKNTMATNSKLKRRPLFKK